MNFQATHASTWGFCALCVFDPSTSLLPAFLSNCPLHSRSRMLARGAIVPCPTKPVAADVGGGLCYHLCRHKTQFCLLVVQVHLLKWASGEWQALFCSHLRVGVMLTQTSRWWCYSLFHNHLVDRWLSQLGLWLVIKSQICGCNVRIFSLILRCRRWAPVSAESMFWVFWSHRILAFLFLTLKVIWNSPTELFEHKLGCCFYFLFVWLWTF